MSNKLQEAYIAGLVDGEGCFSLTYRKDVKKFKSSEKVYYEWKVCFAILLRIDDAGLLENVRNTLGIGALYLGKHEAQLRVNDLNDLYNVIVPFFKKNKLFGKKKQDFKLWAKAVEILYNHKHKGGEKIVKGVRGFKEKIWNKNELDKLNELRQLMKKYKNERLKNFKYSPNYSNSIL